MACVTIEVPDALTTELAQRGISDDEIQMLVVQIMEMWLHAGKDYLSQALIRHWIEALDQQGHVDEQTEWSETRKQDEHVSLNDIPATYRVEIAVALYAQEKLSFGKARELASMTHWAFRQTLAARRIAPHYDVAELEEDVQTLQHAGCI